MSVSLSVCLSVSLSVCLSVILDLPIVDGSMSQLAYTYYVALSSALDNQSDTG